MCLFVDRKWFKEAVPSNIHYIIRINQATFSICRKYTCVMYTSLIQYTGTV